jgi:hypothetical protein
MHLKSYQIDGRVLRTGAANFSASGLKHQELRPMAIMEWSSQKRLGFGPPPWISHAVVVGVMADQAIADLNGQCVSRANLGEICG